MTGFLRPEEPEAQGLASPSIAGRVGVVWTVEDSCLLRLTSRHSEQKEREGRPSLALESLQTCPGPAAFPAGAQVTPCGLPQPSGQHQGQMFWEGVVDSRGWLGAWQRAELSINGMSFSPRACGAAGGRLP